MVDATLSQQELDERVLILKRLRELLVQQRKKFQEYLIVLEKQEFSIVEGNTETLSAHTELGENIVSNIQNLQKVIKPMEDMYRDTNGNDAEIPLLKTDLALIQEKVLVQNEKNRIALATNLTNIRSKVHSFNNPYRNTRSIYARSSNVANLVSVEG